MKIKKLTEEKAMKFKIKECEKDYQNSLGFETTSDQPTLFVFDVNGETVLELTLEQITAILKANGYADPIVARPPELLMLEKGRLQHEKKKYNI